MSFYLESKDKKDCFNCTACSAICPKNCITMERNLKDGYIYPKIDKEKCINCGRCKNVCIKLNNRELQNNIKHAYVLYNKNEEVRKSSASGGISSLLMEYVIEKNGTVYGAAYDSNLVVCHIRATTLEECEKFKTSKYVRSSIEGVYKQVLEDLNAGRLVLFTGTPCQIAGLKSITLNTKLQEKLILCEIMCDCVASPILFEKYKTAIENKYGKKIEKINFRSKENGAHNKSMKIKFEDNSEVILPHKSQNLYSEYMQIFGCGLSAPISCSSCEFEHTNERISDFTIGDYWGKNEILKDDNKGISLMLVSTEKANKIFNEYIKDKIAFEEVEVMQALDNNHVKPKTNILNKTSFMEDLPRLSFNELSDKYVKRYRWRTKIAKILPKGMKEKIKEIIKK